MRSKNKLIVISIFSINSSKPLLEETSFSLKKHCYLVENQPFLSKKPISNNLPWF